MPNPGVISGVSVHGVSDLSSESWTLTRQLSPRRYVRIADQLDELGGIANEYLNTADTSGPRPTVPWAMHLADDRGLYRYLCFDFDAKDGNAAYDAGRMSHWLHELNIPHLTTISGPTGGRHVWIATADGIEAGYVASIARLAKQLLVSLDVSPLTNAATGCVRPPGAPHRSSGFSTVAAGAVATLLHPTVTRADITALREFLIEAGASIPQRRTSPAKGMTFDADGHPHLVGAKRTPSQRVRNILNCAPEQNTSLTLARALAGLARARWRYADVLPLLDSSPAFEHARTRSAGGRRVPLKREAQERRLAADWSRAVYYVATNPISADGDDTSIRNRALAATTVIGAVQQRAQASPGRWGLNTASRAARTGRGRLVHRLVVDAICLYLAQSAQTEVEVDTRRLAQDTGYGRESCRLALLALQEPDDETDPESAWLVKVEEAEGVHGATFRFGSRVSTTTIGSEWAQAVARPRPETPTVENRTWWINQLSSGLAILAHDTFAAPRSLGRSAGRVLTALRSVGSGSVQQVATVSHLPADTIRRGLRRLAEHGLVERDGSGWCSPPSPDLDRVAVRLGVDGILAARAERYAVERGVWAWWQAEFVWMKKRRRDRRKKRPAAGLPLFGLSQRTEYPLYPRSADQRANHRAARYFVEAGALRPDAAAA